MPGPNPHAVEKVKDFKSSSLRLLKFLLPYIVPIVIAIVFAIAGTVFSILSPRLLGNITNQIQQDLTSGNPINLDAITRIGIMLVAIYALSYIFSCIQAYILAAVTMNLSKKFRSEIVKKINSLPFSYFDKKSYGDVLSRVTNDVDTVAITLNQVASQIISSVVMFVGVLVMMFVISWQLALIAVVTVPISLVVSAVVVKKSQPHFRKQQKSLGEINGHIEEVYSGHEVIKVFNGEDDAREVFDQINEELYKSAWKSQFLSGIMQPLMGLIGNLSLVTVVVFGGILAVNGAIMIGDIQSITIYMKMFNQPISQIAQLATQLQSTIAAAERVFEFLDEKEIVPDSDTTYLAPEDVKGDVTFEHVVFGYDSDRIIIKDFSAHAKAGQKIAIVGPTGAGKTTLVNLLMRFYEINSGRILIDGIDIRNLKRENIHNLFGMVLQDTWIFEGSVRDNIVYSKENVTDEELDKACSLANIDHFVHTLTNGYDTILDDKATISQGQKQLITIARAMVENAPMLILDEATSSVDTRTEILIQKAMDELTKGRTSFIIAHRLSTIKNADLILVMNEGDVIEQGTHEELMARKGFYADLYNSQFNNGGEA